MDEREERRIHQRQVAYLLEIATKALYRAQRASKKVARSYKENEKDRLFGYMMGADEAAQRSLTELIRKTAKKTRSAAKKNQEGNPSYRISKDDIREIERFVRRFERKSWGTDIFVPSRRLSYRELRDILRSEVTSMAPPTLDALKLETYPELGGEKSEERLEKVRNAKKEYLARVLDIPVGAVSEALNEKGSDVSNLQIRILEHIRPSFKVHEKPVVWFRIEKQSGSSSGSLNIKVDKETGARSVRTQTYRIKIEQYDGHNAWYLASYHREASDVDLKMGSAWNISIFGDSEDKTLLSTETVRCLADRAQFIFGEDGRPLSWVKTASVDVGDATEVVNLGGMGSYVREAFKTLAYAKEAYFEIGSALFAISRENRKPMREVFREGVSQ